MHSSASPKSRRAGASDAVLFILAPPRSVSWTVCAMLGGHPQTYALPEMHLMIAESVGEWLQVCESANFAMSDGTMRAVAQICFGEQTEESIRLATGWMRRRSHLTTAMVLELLGNRVSPRLLVERSPSVVYRPESMALALRMFPTARFLHVVRHPRTHGDSVMEGLSALGSMEPVPDSDWLRQLAAFPVALASEASRGVAPAGRDPQRGWYALNMNIARFLETVPPGQRLRIRAEDLIGDPDPTLRAVATWLGLRADDEAINEMKHPERSPFARLGPTNAPYGNDWCFLRTSVLESNPEVPASLEGPLPWRDDGGGFASEVVSLAREFGYQ